MNPVTNLEKDLLQDLVAKTNYVLLYEDYELQNMALEQIPVEELSDNASAKAAAIASSSKEKVSEEDLLILELLQWFKFSFFSWVDVPKCDSCGNNPEKVGMVAPLEEEQQWEAHRVELYFCPQCQKQIRFPRYNHPQKLLRTKKGRCGEWANCFTFMCRSLGYDARLVFEWSDHVWTEVYSHSQKRWIHCDSCENAYDKPLMYEIGWKKKISYAIAFSKDEVQDVTWRYCTNFSEVMSRRTLYREEFLLSLVFSLTNSLQKNLTNERRAELLDQKVMELVSFLSPPSSNEELGGRTSGSEAWREARGEYHPGKKDRKYVFTLDSEETLKKFFHLKYSCAIDRYVRVSSSCPIEVDKWETLTYGIANVFRKVEQDWNMAYLARVENCPEGSVHWKFDFSDSGLVINNLKLTVDSKTFENGAIDWIIDTGKLALPITTAASVKVSDVEGLSKFTLIARLRGGKGRLAWQHAQLFRQPLSSRHFPLEIEIKFIDKPENPGV